MTYEIYLNKKNISKDDWSKFIKMISNYNGTLKKWSIIIYKNLNEIRYYLKTKCNLPATINNLDPFLIKPVGDISKPKYNYYSLTIPKLESNFIDLVNHYEVKDKGDLFYLEINFLKLFEDKIKSNAYYYIRKNNKIIKYNILITIPNNILAIDFDGNKRYFYKKSPKYLDISKSLHLFNTDIQNALLKIDTFPYIQGDFYLSQTNFDFDKHSIIIGSSGSGKSKFISSLIKNIAKNNYLNKNYKVVVIDPHAALENDIGGLGKVIDFNTDTNTIDLFINNDSNIVSNTEVLLDLFKSLISDEYNSKIERVLRYSIHLLLASQNFNFNSLRKLLLNLEYRNKLLQDYKSNLPISVEEFFLTDFNELRTRSYNEAISPIISFIDEMEMLPVFNLDNNKNNLEDTIKNNFLTLFSLDRTKFGNKITKTISGLIMQQLLNIIQSKNIDEHIIFIIDEVSIIENPILTKYLSESRKYNLSLILAGQYFNQINEDLKNAIFANVINYYIFRVSKLDATLLVDNFNMKIPSDDTKETKIKLLTELNDRECITRISAHNLLIPAFKSKTIDFSSIPRINEQKPKEITNKFFNKKTKTNFQISNISLKDILIQNSTNKKGVNNNE